ncbi:hypothetical protein KIN20_032047 [Parelaphostrongylus tenuis]|uniref:Uncharacterized protein n=1 Tax=Parelaphostrongylus tenuis TaxID=148309 RepID=A0AAD5WHR6_PARTN|nr:hypothetical protein KIN20_032047 [Parelaphostrongylus tenuis]
MHVVMGIFEACFQSKAWHLVFSTLEDLNGAVQMRNEQWQLSWDMPAPFKFVGEFDQIIKKLRCAVSPPWFNFSARLEEEIDDQTLEISIYLSLFMIGRLMNKKYDGFIVKFDISSGAPSDCYE